MQWAVSTLLGRSEQALTCALAWNQELWAPLTQQSWGIGREGSKTRKTAGSSGLSLLFHLRELVVSWFLLSSTWSLQILLPNTACHCVSLSWFLALAICLPTMGVAQAASLPEPPFPLSGLDIFALCLLLSLLQTISYESCQWQWGLKFFFLKGFEIL